MAVHLKVEMDYVIMTVNSQIIYRPADQRKDPEPDNDHELYVGNVPQNYTIEKFINFAKKSGPIYSVRLLKGGGGINKGFGYITYRHLSTINTAIEMFNGTFLTESDSTKPLIVQKSLRNTIMMIYGLLHKNNNRLYIRNEINYFVTNHPSLMLKFECEDDNKLFISFKSLKAAQIFKKKLKDSFKLYGAKMYYFNDTENWERWEALKKNISVNPRGNHVRFVPIIANNVNRPNALPSTSSQSRKLLFKPFIPKYIKNCSSNENINLTQYQNHREKENVMTANHMKTHQYPTKFNMRSTNSVNLQFSQNKQDIKKPKTLTSFEEKCNMNALKDSLPKLPLHTIWTSNSAKDFGCTLPIVKNAFRKQYPSNLNCMPQAIQSTNYFMKSEYQTQPQVQPKPSTTINNSRFLKQTYSLSTSSSRKLYPIAENMNTSFFTSVIENPSSAPGINSNTSIQNSLNCVNQPFNMDNIWKN